MIAPLAKFLDWWAVQIVAMMKPANEFDNPRLAEALQFVKSPDFVNTDAPPAKLEFNGARDFHFPTPRPCAFAENNVVHGRLYRCAGRWQERPAIILLPGWNDSASYQLRFPFIARQSNRAGFNVATLVAPYHFQRCPRQHGPFDAGNLLRFVESAAQGLAEIHALTGWLLKEGCPSVALWGYSLGAWYSALAACRDARLAAVVLVALPARMNPFVEERALRPRVRARLQRVTELSVAVNTTAVNLTTNQPVISPEKILLVAGIYDAICPEKDVEDLWKSWGQPEMWWLRHGHVGVCCGFVPGLPGRVLKWLSPRLNVPVVKVKETAI